MSSTKRPLVVIRGRVSLEPVRTGTGSAHIGVVLKTEEGERIILVRLGGNPFDDKENRALEGHVLSHKDQRLQCCQRLVGSRRL